MEHLPASHLRVLRLVCRSWEGAAGRLLRALRPEALPPGCGASLGARFPNLRALDLSHCMTSVCLHTPQALRLQVRAAGCGAVGLSVLSGNREEVETHRPPWRCVLLLGDH